MKCEVNIKSVSKSNQENLNALDKSVKYTKNLNSQDAILFLWEFSEIF